MWGASRHQDTPRPPPAPRWELFLCFRLQSSPSWVLGHFRGRLKRGSEPGLALQAAANGLCHFKPHFPPPRAGLQSG